MVPQDSLVMLDLLGSLDPQDLLVSLVMTVMMATKANKDHADSKDHL